MDRLSPEARREIDRHLDVAVHRTEVVAAALWRYAKRAVWIVLLLIAVTYIADYVTFRLHGTFGTVNMRCYYAVGLKNGKTEMYFVDPENETCTNSIFPQQGDSPCWYLRKHNLKEVHL